MRKRVQAVVAFVAAEFGAEELGILVALALIVVGLWSVWRPGVWLVPGVTLLWLSLPSRAPLVLRAPLVAEKPKRSAP